MSDAVRVARLATINEDGDVVDGNGVALSAEGGGVAAPARTVVAGNLGSAYTLDLDEDAEVRLFGTLSASPCAITISNWPEDTGKVELYLSKTAAQARTLTINGNAVSIPTDASAAQVTADTADGGDTIFIGTPSAPGATGNTGNTGNTGPAGPINTIADEGTPLTQRGTLNFIGGAVSVADNAGQSRTDVTIASAGSWPPKRTIGEYYGTIFTTYGTGTQTADRATYSKFVCNESETFDRIAINVTVAGGAGSTARLGIHADDGNGKPGAVVLDAGTIATDATGIRAITINQTLPAGLYHLVCQNNYVTTSPTMTYGNVVPTGWLNASFTNASQGGHGLSPRTGALLASPAVATFANVVAVGLRKA